MSQSYLQLNKRITYFLVERPGLDVIRLGAVKGSEENLRLTTCTLSSLICQSLFSRLYTIEPASFPCPLCGHYL